MRACTRVAFVKAAARNAVKSNVIEISDIPRYRPVLKRQSAGLMKFSKTNRVIAVISRANQAKRRPALKFSDFHKPPQPPENGFAPGECFFARFPFPANNRIVVAGGAAAKYRAVRHYPRPSPATDTIILFCLFFFFLPSLSPSLSFLLLLSLSLSLSLSRPLSFFLFFFFFSEL